MGEYDNLFEAIENLKDENEPHDVRSILRIVTSSDFRALQKQWFSSTPPKSSDMSQVDYPKEIADYTLNAIDLYEDAIPHKVVSCIELHFYQDASAEIIQPQIDIHFDTGLYHIDIGMFWNDEVGLEREGKKNCQTMAETIWYEYKDENYEDTIVSLANYVKQAVVKKHPKADVKCKIS